MGVQQVALVLRDLARRMQRVASLAAVVDRHAVGDVRAADLGPLLELDDDRGVAGGRVRAGDHHVEALATSAAASARRGSPWSRRSAILQDVRHRAKRVPPRVDLGQARAVAELVEEPVRELVREARLHGVGDELFAGALVEVQLGHLWRPAMLAPSSTTAMTARRNPTNVAPIANPTPSFTPVHTERSTSIRAGPKPSGPRSEASSMAVDGRATSRRAGAPPWNAAPHFGQKAAFAGRSVEQLAHRAVLINAL